MTTFIDIEKTNAYILGGEIAGLASAAYLIRDGRILLPNSGVWRLGTCDTVTYPSNPITLFAPLASALQALLDSEAAS